GMAFFCSQRCLEASHHQRESGLVQCAACAKSFELTLALQIVFTGGKRNYACGESCRRRVLAAVRTIRLGEFLDPTRVPEAVAGAESQLLAAETPPVTDKPSRITRLL